MRCEGYRIESAAVTPAMEALARKLISEGASTTKVYRAMGWRSANRLYAWLKDKPELQAALKHNAAECKRTFGYRWREQK